MRVCCCSLALSLVVTPEERLPLFLTQHRRADRHSRQLRPRPQPASSQPAPRSASLFSLFFFTRQPPPRNSAMSAPLHNNEHGAQPEVVEEKHQAPPAAAPAAAAPAPQQEGNAPAAPTEKKAGRFDKTFVRAHYSSHARSARTDATNGLFWPTHPRNIPRSLNSSGSRAILARSR